MSHKSNSLATNTRKDVECMKEIGGSVTTRKPRQNKPSTQEKDCIAVRNGGTQHKDTNGGTQNDVNVPTQEELGGGDVSDMGILATTT
jgi:hypothetical protein